MVKMKTPKKEPLSVNVSIYQGNPCWVPIWLWLSKPFWDPMFILEPILVVGLGCSLGVRAFDPWPYFWAERDGG